MTRKYFGTDGIRGRAGTGVLRPDRVVLLGRALGTVFREMGAASCLLGRDTRPSGPMIAAALAAGLAGEGVAVHEAGVLTTPGTWAVARALKLDAAVVISASHNPADDNGIKVLLGDGTKLPGELEARVETLLEEGPDGFPDRTGREVGSLQVVQDGADRYVDLLLEACGRDLDLKGRKIVVDCANGAGMVSAPHVFRRLGAEVIALHCGGDDAPINAGCGALHPETVATAVQREGAFFGVALDGDGDRLCGADETGRPVDGDQILAVLARHLNKAGRLPGDTVVATVMSNAGLELSLSEAGLHLHRTAVGDKNVSQAMGQSGWALGGEQSGHVIFAPHGTPTPGDGTATALAFLRAVLDLGETVSRAVGCITLLPQSLINVPVERKVDFGDLPSVQAVRDEVEADLAGQGRVYLRYSGTENLARILVEGQDAASVEAMAHRIARAVEADLG